MSRTAEQGQAWKGGIGHTWLCVLRTWAWPSMAAVLFLMCGAGCSTAGPERTSSTDHMPNTPRQAVLPDAEPAIRAHSTIMDTAGMAADLRIIERKLGPLDPAVRGELLPLEVEYFTFSDSTCGTVDTTRTWTGILIVHSCIAEDVRAVFRAMLADTFPIAKVIPINRYGLNADSTGWNDAASMADNNTSAFNYRGKPTSGRPSKHGLGISIDINPLLNPMLHHRASGVHVQPPQGRYDPSRPGTLTRANTGRFLKGLGWSWGGRWPRPQDYQHIEKAHGRCAHFRFNLE